MTAESLVVALAWANVAVWTTLSTWAVWRRRRRLGVPDYLMAAAIVATFAASLGGALTALGFIDALPDGSVPILGGAWRGAMLSAGVYAIVAATRAARPAR